MSFWDALLLGVVQGFTEFLPVSSSGHLVLTSILLGVREPSIAFDILLHFGTLVAILVAFWDDICDVTAAFGKVLAAPSQLRRLWREDHGVRLLGAILVGTVPAGLVGLFLRDLVVQLFMMPMVTGSMLIVTGTILFLSTRLQPGGKGLGTVKLSDGWWIGVGQALAIMPGISRSGTTISAGLLWGLDRETAARFSFLLTIPAILGAMVFAVEDLFGGNPESVIGASWAMMAFGTVVSGVTGYLAIRILLRFVRQGRLIVFSYYTWTVGSLVILISVLS